VDWLWCGLVRHVFNSYLLHVNKQVDAVDASRVSVKRDENYAHLRRYDGSTASDQTSKSESVEGIVEAISERPDMLDED
jgi:hypothetical protein